MSRREFEYSDGKSHKFWNIQIDGASYEVTYGRVGTKGQSSSKSFDSDEGCKKAADKLIKAKTSKGYVEKAGGANEDSNNGLSPNLFSSTKDQDDVGALKMFVGKRVAEFTSAGSIKSGNKTVYRIRVDYDSEESFTERVNAFFDTPAAANATGFIVGYWGGEHDDDSSVAVDLLVKNNDKMPNLKGLFIGDICQEENEMSWICQSNLTPAIKAFPNLEIFRSRGGEGLAFKSLKHQKLRALAIESGGLDRTVVSQICKSDLPNLEYLELWLGSENYGANVGIKDLKPILNGKLFPKLKYLGLRNAEISDEIANVICSSPIVRRIETLDLSLGVLSDAGATALLELPTDGCLKRLDIHHHYVSAPLVKKLRALPFAVDSSDRQEDEDWGDDDGPYRYIAVSE